MGQPAAINLTFLAEADREGPLQSVHRVQLADGGVSYSPCCCRSYGKGSNCRCGR